MPGSIGEYEAEVADVWFVNTTSVPTVYRLWCSSEPVPPVRRRRTWAVPLGLGLPSLA